MSSVNWMTVANSGFDAFGNFQGGWEVGVIMGAGLVVWKYIEPCLVG